MTETNQMKLIYVYRTLQPKAKQYTFFSSFHENFSKLTTLLADSKSHQMLGNQNNILYSFGQQLNKYIIATQTLID